MSHSGVCHALDGALRPALDADGMWLALLQLAEDGNYSVKALNFLHSQIVERECQVEIHHFNAVNRRFLVSCRGVERTERLRSQAAKRDYRTKMAN